MKSLAADALGQVLIALAGSDAYKLADAVDRFRTSTHFGSVRAVRRYGDDLPQVVAAAQRLWFQARTAEALKLPAAVAWRLALTAIEAGLERYLEDMHRREEGQQVAEG